MLSNYVGVILAGGRGRRMGPLGEEYPKALLPVGNEPLVGHHLRFLHDLGADDVYIIVGHRALDLVRTLGDGARYGVNIRYVEQGMPLGSAHALGRIRSVIHEPFLLVLGDYFFSVPEPAQVLGRWREGEGSVILAKHESDRRLIAEACELHVDGDGRVHRIVEKPWRPATDLKGCGVYALQPEIFDAIARTPRTALRDEYELSVSLALHVEAGCPLYAEALVAWDFNFTYPEDVLACNLAWLQQQRKTEFIADGAHVEQEAYLQSTVVGTCARVARRSRLTEVVVFPGASVREGDELRRALVTPEHVYPMA